MKLNAIDWSALVLVIVVGVNWGLIGFLEFNLIAAIFGSMTALARIMYALARLSALYLLYTAAKLAGPTKSAA